MFALQIISLTSKKSTAFSYFVFYIKTFLCSHNVIKIKNHRECIYVTFLRSSNILITSILFQ